MDQVVGEIGPKSIVTRTYYAARASMIDAHRPGGSVVIPGVLLAEQAAQSALILGHASKWLADDEAAFLGRIDCRLIRPVASGSLVTASVRLAHDDGQNAGFKAELSVQDEVVANIGLAVAKLPFKAA